MDLDLFDSLQEFLHEPTATPAQPLCVFKHKSILAYIIGLVLIFGIFISYFPQHISVIRKKSSKGMSLFTFFILNIGTTCNAINSIFENWDSAFVCCSRVSFLKCNASLLAMYQICMGFINTFPLLLLTLIYWPIYKRKEILDVISLNDDALDYSGSSQNEIHASTRKVRSLEELEEENYRLYHKDPQLYEVDQTELKFQRMGWIAFSIYFIIFICIIPATGVVVAKFTDDQEDGHIFKDYTFGIGVISAVANVIQWSPQIWKTFQTLEVGSLSILMLLLQAPGAYLVVIFQIMFSQSVSTWLPYLISGTSQVVLILLCTYIKIKDRFFRPQSELIITGEEQPLLQ